MVARLSAALSLHAPPLVSALLHSLWQAALVAIVCKMALRAIPVRLPNVRYGLCLGGLSLVVLLFVVTWRLECPVRGQTAAEPPVTVDAVAAYDMTYQPPAVSAVPVAPLPSASPASPRRDVPWQAVFASFWLLGVLLMVLRAAHVLRSERRLASASTPVADPAILALLAELRGHLRVVRRVALAAVEAACSPAVVGVVAPVILVPAGLLTGASTMHLRAVLAHELAHIRRWDLWVNLLQLLVESLLFHNPFVWLLSAQIRHEREACCDAVAAECCGGGPTYARVLVDVGEAVLAQSAAMSFARPSGLSDRVRRLLGLRPVLDSWRLPARSLCAGLGAALLVLLVAGQGTVKATDAVLSAKDRLQLLERTAARQNEEGAVAPMHYVGRVATPDDGPLPEGTRMTVRTATPERVVTTFGQIDRKTGRFSVRAVGNCSWFWVEAPGYAPWFEGATPPRPEGTADLGLWLLEPESPLVLRVLDEDSKPVPEATVEVQWQPAKDTVFDGPKRTVDVAGECTVPLVTDFPMSLAIRAPGFEPTAFEGLAPADGTPLVLRLPRSLPLRLAVRDKQTGLPVRGARVRLLAMVTERGVFDGRPSDKPLACTSDAEGTCAIDSLHREARHWLIVEAEGYGPELLEGVSPGKSLDVRLGPPRVVRGTVTGRLDQLRASNGRPTLNLAWDLRDGPFSSCLYGLPAVPVQIAGGIGIFRIEGLWGGEFSIRVGEQTASFSTGSGSAEVHLDLVPPKTTREVRLEFVARHDCPLPRGTVRMHFRGPTDRYASDHDIPVKGGAVVCRAPVGKPFRYRAAGTLGGWFPSGEFRELPAGDGPLTVPVAFVPAGAIAVSLVEADGSPADGFLVHVREIRKSPQRTDGPLGVEGKTSAGTDDGIYAFTATPLPLGGTYELSVSRGFTYVTTGPVRLTERHPVHRRELTLAGDATIRAEALDPDGRPIPGLPLSLDLVLPDWRVGSIAGLTDGEGWFQFRDVVRYPDAKYWICAYSTRDFVPQRVAVEDLARPLTIRMQRGLVVSGRLLDSKDDTPLRGMMVQVSAKAVKGAAELFMGIAEEPTDRDGNFRISNLLPGTYVLRCDELLHAAEGPTVEAGQKEPVVWRVGRPE